MRSGFVIGSLMAIAGGVMVPALLPTTAMASTHRSTRQDAWSAAAGNAAGTSSTTSTDITPGNVSSLRLSWSRHTLAGISQLTAGNGRLIYVKTRNRPVVVARRLSTGHILWQRGLANEIPQAPVYAGGRVFAGYTDGASSWIVALSASNGHRLWRRRFDAGEFGGVSVGALGSGRLVAAFNSRTVALSASTGRTEWSAQHFGQNPVYRDGRFYVEGLNGAGHVYAGKTGHVLTTFSDGADSPPAVTRRNLIISGELGGATLAAVPTHGCPTTSCAERWFTNQSERAAGQIAVAHGRIAVIVSATPSFLDVYRERSGHRVAHVPIGDEGSGPTIAGDVIFRTDEDRGYVDAFSLLHPHHRLFHHRVSRGRFTGSPTSVAVLGNTIALAVNGKLAVYRLP
jgi:outer membrane protein assembly factor BamB